MLRGVPVTADLREIGVLGVIGPPEPVDALLRRLPYLNVDGPVSCLAGITPQTRTERVEELRDLVTERLKARGRRFAEEVVVILDGARALRRVSPVRLAAFPHPSRAISRHNQETQIFARHSVTSGDFLLSRGKRRESYRRPRCFPDPPGKECHEQRPCPTDSAGPEIRRHDHRPPPDQCRDPAGHVPQPRQLQLITQAAEFAAWNFFGVTIGDRATDAFLSPPSPCPKPKFGAVPTLAPPLNEASSSGCVAMAVLKNSIMPSKPRMT
ncbi:hypothetical protein WBK31_32675 [Nonomuraea sp. N2-4H]|uniref:hypothetical protein n=1 Tax=Nonomuraea sp. N2-4H TaxID=3128898 RepID=UPI003249422C